MPHRNQNALPFLPPAGSTARLFALIFITFAPLLIGAVALWLGQDNNWDLRNYHWYNAYAYLNNRHSFDIVPSQTPFFYTPFLDIPFYLLGTHLSAKASAFFLGTIQGFNLSLLFILAHATLVIPNPKHKVGICAALSCIGMAGGGGIALIGTTFYDNVTSLGLFASAALIMRLYPTLIKSAPHKAFALAFLCGFPAGLLMGLKLPFIVFGLGLALALLFVMGSRARRILLTLSFGTGMIAGFALCFAPWGWFLYSEFGNPIFPYFNDLFASPLAPLQDARDTKFIPTSPWERAFYPFIFSLNPLRVGEIQWQDFRILIFYTLLPLSVLMRILYGRNKTEPNRLASFYAKRYLLWTAIFSYFAWLILFGIYRYLIPLEMMAPLLIVLLMGIMPIRSEQRTLWTIFLLGFILITIQPGDWGRKKEGWLTHPVEVTLPTLGPTKDLMILMAGYEPYAHVIPSFPPHIPFIRIQSNFVSPEKQTGFNNQINKRIKNHQGIFKLLIPKWELNTAKQALSFFHLEIISTSCRLVKDHLYTSQLQLCNLKRSRTLVLSHDDKK